MTLTTYEWENLKDTIVDDATHVMSLMYVYIIYILFMFFIVKNGVFHGTSSMGGFYILSKRN